MRNRMKHRRLSAAARVLTGLLLWSACMVTAGCAPCAVAPPAVSSAWPDVHAPEGKPRFVPMVHLNVLDVLPDPPATRSVENDREYETLQRAVAKASPNDKARARHVQDNMTVFDFRDVVGAWFTPESCPEAAQFFADAGATAKTFSDAAKDKFQRDRPSTRPGFKPLYPERPGSKSYPSGHSTRAMLWAELLAEMYPQQRGALLERGRELGYDRMIGGVHFPSDVYAGRVVGHAVARQLLANPTFHAELNQVKQKMDEAKANAASRATPAVSPRTALR